MGNVLDAARPFIGFRHTYLCPMIRYQPQR